VRPSGILLGRDNALNVSLEMATHATFDPPPLGADEIHLWHFSLAGNESSRSALRGVLDEVECARADRFFRPIHGARFTVGRATVRLLLASYLGIAPTNVAFDYGAAGKPELQNDVNTRDLLFNLSHSDDRAICAIAQGTTLGIDLEANRSNTELLKIARRFFATAEVEQLLSLPEEEQLVAFYQCWTAKEALVKAWGHGLATPLDRFVVHVAPRETSLLRLDLPALTSCMWRVQAVEGPAGYSASVAYSGNPRRILHHTISADRVAN